MERAKAISGFLLATGLIGLGIFLWRTTRTPSLETGVGTHAATPTSSRATGTLPGGGDSRDPDEYRRWYHEASQRDRLLDWKRPIDFWGKVIDEQDQPVAGAEVEFAWNDLSRAGTSKARLRSAEDGSFALTGKRGKGLSVAVRKDGYHQVPGRFSGSYEYALPHERFIPNPSDPVVFRLQRMRTFVELHSREVVLGLPNDGSELRLGVLEDRLNTNGQIRARIFMGPMNNERRVSAWRFVITIPGGGFVPIDPTTLPFEAPAEGYVETIEISCNPEDDRLPMKKADYYVRMGSLPIFGRIYFQVKPSPREHYANSALRLTYAINLSGSRNLEGDPSAPVPIIPFADLRLR
jgi:hypothetical protein